MQASYLRTMLEDWRPTQEWQPVQPFFPTYCMPSIGLHNEPFRQRGMGSEATDEAKVFTVKNIAIMAVVLVGISWLGSRTSP